MKTEKQNHSEDPEAGNISKTLLVVDKIIEWDSSKENDTQFLINYYEGRIAYWSKYPKNIGGRIIDNFRKGIKTLSN